MENLIISMLPSVRQFITIQPCKCCQFFVAHVYTVKFKAVHVYTVKCKAVHVYTAKCKAVYVYTAKCKVTFTNYPKHNSTSKFSHLYRKNSLTEHDIRFARFATIFKNFILQEVWSQRSNFNLK